MIAKLLLLGSLITSDTTHPPVPKVIVVRHAERASAIETDPSLSDAGRVRAIVLDSLLANQKVVAIYVTSFKRTAETAAPLAKRFHLTPVVFNPANIPGYAKAIADSARGKEGVVVVISHSNTIPAIIEALGGKKPPQLCDGAYSHLFTVEPGKPALVIDGHYGAKDPPGADKCSVPAMGGAGGERARR